MKSAITIACLVASMAAATNTCEYNELMNERGPHQCYNDTECGGARTCSQWGWCQGESGCESNQPDPVEELQAEVDALEGDFFQLETEVAELQAYIGDNSHNADLIETLVSGSIETSTPAVAENALQQMARTMFREHGNQDEFIRDLHNTSGVTLYLRFDCTSYNTNLDGPSTVDSKFINNRGIPDFAKSAKVPPGWKLEMWMEDNEDTVPLTIYGRMRDDLQGV